MEGREVALKVRVERKFGDTVLSMETGFLAKQAAGCVFVQFGETCVIVAAATAPRGWVSIFSRFLAITANAQQRAASFRVGS